MKKKKFRSIIKKSVCFFVASLIALFPLIGIPFTVSAADSDSKSANYPSYSTASSLEYVATFNFGYARFLVPSTEPYVYIRDPENYNIDRTLVGGYGMNLGDYPLHSQDSLVYRFRSSDGPKNIGHGILQIHLKSTIALQPGVTYRISFDVTPMHSFYKWNYVWIPSIAGWVPVTERGDSLSYALSTNFYRFNAVDEAIMVECVSPYTSAVDTNFGDTRYRFSYQVQFDSAWTSPQYLYLCISVPYNPATSTSITTYVYNPLIEVASFASPDLSDVDSLDDAEASLIAIVDSHRSDDWFDAATFGKSVLGTDFLKGFKGAGDLLGKFYNELPFLKSLIFFSLTLGLSGFVLNLGTSFIRAFKDG